MVENVIYANDWVISEDGDLIPVAPDYANSKYEHAGWIAPTIAGVVAAGGTIAGLVTADKSRDAARRAQQKQAEIDQAFLEEQAKLQRAQLEAQQNNLLASQQHEIALSEEKKELFVITGAILLSLAGLFFIYKRLF